MLKRVREIRGLFVLDFSNDGNHVDGCIVGESRYLHINAHGDMEPRAFIHCPRLIGIINSATPTCSVPDPYLTIRKFLLGGGTKNGAKSTQPIDTETAEQLYAECKPFADAWEPIVDYLWRSCGDSLPKPSDQATHKAIMLDCTLLKYSWNLLSLDNL